MSQERRSDPALGFALLVMSLGLLLIVAFIVGRVRRTEKVLHLFPMHKRVSGV